MDRDQRPSARTPDQIGELVTWIGAGRKLTRTGRLTLADARTLIALLDTGDRLDAAIGERVFTTKSSDELYLRVPINRRRSMRVEAESSAFRFNVWRHAHCVLGDSSSVQVRRGQAPLSLAPSAFRADLVLTLRCVGAERASASRGLSRRAPDVGASL
jgi:hypothetical protein